MHEVATEVSPGLSPGKIHKALSHAVATESAKTYVATAWLNLVVVSFPGLSLGLLIVRPRTWVTF